MSSFGLTVLMGLGILCLGFFGFQFRRFWSSDLKFWVHVLARREFACCNDCFFLAFLNFPVQFDQILKNPSEASTNKRATKPAKTSALKLV